MILRPWARVFPPPSIADASCFMLIAVFVPLTYMFHLTVLMPEFCAVGSFWYTFVWLVALFVVFNVVSNFLACILVDTSIKTDILKPPKELEKIRKWHMCDSCQALVPPRSWHCETCNICILKRDHHCRFTCCCVGHHNYRYYFYFMLYMCIGSAYVTVTASIYIWYLRGDYYMRPYTLLTAFMPAVSLTVFASWENFYFMLYELNILACTMSAIVLIFNRSIFQRGSVIRERLAIKYNRGLLGNMEMVFGRRMHLTWLSPFVSSELPHDGINWYADSKKE